MINKIKIFIVLFIFFVSWPAVASEFVDTDGDRVSDRDETEVYKTDPNKSDTDDDGYDDWVELNNGYSPHNTEQIKLEDNDFDNDGLSDRMELNFHTDLSNPDTDNDGFKDGDEINNGYDPLSSNKEKLIKRIEVNLAKQELYYFLGGVRMKTYSVSSGKNNSTPKGKYKISNKVLKAWSSYGLWMLYWMGLNGGRIGLHELPVWPNGYREGENHLGTPVSHGCVRLGVSSAEELYNSVGVGTEVVIY